jgi:hypothetical protein
VEAAQGQDQVAHAIKPSVMDIVQAVSGYVTKMVSTGDSATGSPAKMKILLLDSDTVGLSLWFKQGVSVVLT